MTFKDQQQIAALQNRITVLEQALSDIEVLVIDLEADADTDLVEEYCDEINIIIERVMLQETGDEEEEF